MTSLLDLLDGRPTPSVSRDLPLEQRFDAWRERNPEIVEHVIRLALAASRRGARRLSMKSLFEAVRASGTFDGGGPEPFRVDNTMTAPMARWLMDRYPELAGKFELRRRRSS